MASELHRDAGQAIAARQVELAEAIVARQYALHPELADRYGPRGRRKCLQDANFHLEYLAESLVIGQLPLFVDYVVWARIMLSGRDIPADDLARNLECLLEILQEALPRTLFELAATYVEAAAGQLKDPLPERLPFLSPEQPLAGLAREYLDALLAGDRHLASRLVLGAVDSGVTVQDIYLYLFQPVQHEIGRLWQVNQISVAQEHYCTAATQLIMSQLYPYLFAGERSGRTLVAACVAGELHEIGARMVTDCFELSGWDTFYLGANTPAAGILQTLRDQRADLLGISSTIVPHLKAVEELIGEVRWAPDLSRVKILVGGYPFNVAPGMWEQMGADGCAGDAAGAVELGNRLLAVGGSL